MGDATYYMRVKFESEEKAAKAAPQIDLFLKRMASASDFWQSSRSGQGDGELRAKFPDVMTILEILPAPVEDPSLNHYAGLLDSPAENFLGDYYIQQHQNYVKFSGTVWHFAEWAGLACAMIEHFGAEAAGWVSDEYCEPNYFDLTGVL